MKILIIRRDNIGDLVCTTPLIRSLRQQLPNAQIDVLATRYNRAVLENNPDINALHSYIKAKHRAPGESLLSIYWQRIITIWKLRRSHFDVAIIPGNVNASALRFARWVAPKRIITQDMADQEGTRHEVEYGCQLLQQMGLSYETPAPLVIADPSIVASLRSEHGLPESTSFIGIHISARKSSQRWPTEYFTNLLQQLHRIYPKTAFMLLWAPGSANNPQHPGDDEKAEAILTRVEGLPIFPVPTHHLEELIAALSLCDSVICADGGAMHLAAGLGKPLIALFGQSSVDRWRPWHVSHVVLQKPRLEVKDIGVDEVVDAFLRLNNLSTS